MNAEQMLAGWRRFKEHRSVVCRLVEPFQAEHEYQGMQRGHPSTYAFVRFQCLPARALEFEMGTAWPAGSEKDSAHVEDAMATAIVDVLLSPEVPAIGCRVRCVAVGWDDVASSPLAFYRATRDAITKLRDEAKWSR